MLYVQGVEQFFVYFLENSPCIYAFKHQISHLIVTIIDEIRNESVMNLLTASYARIFAFFTNLKYLDVDVNDTYGIRRSVLNGLPSTTCFSSSIVDLRIKMNNFEDCICLLDGRLSQLHTLFLKLDYVYDPVSRRAGVLKVKNDSSKIIKNSVKKFFHF